MDTDFNAPTLARLRTYVKWVCLISVVSGFIVLLAWIGVLPQMTTNNPRLAAMKPLTAVCFVVAGAALWLLSKPNPKPGELQIGFGLAGLLLSVAGLVVLEYISQSSFGIDLWLFRSKVLQEGIIHPGRPAPATAICLLLLGIALLTLHLKSVWLTNTLAFLILTVGSLAVIGYSFGVSSLYTLGKFNPVALYTATLFLLLSVSLLCVFPERTIMSILITERAGGKLARRLLPAVILIPFVLGWLCLQGELLGFYDSRFGVALYATSNIVVFVSLVFMDTRYLNRLDDERETVLRSLTQMENKYRTLVEQTPAIVYVDEISGNWLYVSPQIERILGYSAETWLADRSIFRSRVHQQDLAGIQAQINSCVTTGVPLISEYRFLAKDGRLLWLHDEATVTHSPDTGKTILQGVIIDITERKRNEEQLRYQASLLENVNDAIVASDENYILRAWNPAAEKMYGWKAADVIGKPGVDVLQTNFLGVDPDQMRRQIAETGRYVGEAMQVRQDGTRIPVEVASIALRDHTEKITGYVSVNRDISERKKAEERFALVVESAPNAIVLVNQNDQIVMVNPQAAKIFGYTREQMNNLQLDQLVPERYHNQHASYRAGFFTNPQIRPMGMGRDLYALHKDGTEFPVEIGLAPIETVQGSMVMASIVDISARRQAEKEREAQLLLAAKYAELDRFAYTVSHDLKSPLVTIKGFLKFLEQDIQHAEAGKIAHDINFIRNAMNKMEKLLNGVLEVARAGAVLNEIQNLSFEELANDVIDLLRGPLEARGARVIIQPDLPKVHGDRLRLSQVLQNLVENAIKYRDQDRETLIEIGHAGQTAPGKETLFVRDNGIGIPGYYSEQLFDMFSQHDAASEGHGIGLAIVKRIIDAHGGRIWVESKEGEGSIFYFTLPAQPKTDSVL